MRRTVRLARAFAAAALALCAACSKPPEQPLQLDGSRLTVRNTTSDEWRDVELLLNHYFRLPVRSIAAGGVFQARLDQFVEYRGQRFDFGRMQITDLRLKAKRPSGEPIEIVMPFRKDRLTDAFGGQNGGQK
jgi:hypothetical protein